MSYSGLDEYTFGELKKLAFDMGLKSRRSRKEYIRDISHAFDEYKKYKTDKIDKYTKVRQLGNKGKEGVTYLVNDKNGKEFAMKTFRKTKSSNTLKREYSFQKRASLAGISPRVVEYDTVSKYIVMEKMDEHLLDVIKNKKGELPRKYQQQIIDIFQTLDSIDVFHADSNILNYMLKNGKVYIIDFGFAKEINSRLTKKLKTNVPNVCFMTLGLVLKLRDMGCKPSSWKYLKKYISRDDINKFQIE